MKITSTDRIIDEYNRRIVSIQFNSFKLNNLYDCDDLFQDLVQSMVTGTSFYGKYYDCLPCKSCEYEYNGEVEVFTRFILKNNLLKIKTMNTSFTIKCTKNLIKLFFKAFKLLKPSKIILPVLDNYEFNYTIYNGNSGPIELNINNLCYRIHSCDNIPFIEKITNNQHVDFSFNNNQVRFSYKDNTIKVWSFFSRITDPHLRRPTDEYDVQFLKLTPSFFDFLKILEKNNFL